MGQILDLGIGYGDAPIRPVHLAMQTAYPSEVFTKPMNLNVASRLDTQFARTLTI
jgi:hypothetical protein